MEPNQFETYVLAVPRTRSNLSSSNNQEVIVIPDVESQNRVQEDGSNKRRRTEEEGEAAAASHSKDINEPLVCPICMDIWTSRRRTSHLIIQSLEAKSTALESKVLRTMIGARKKPNGTREKLHCIFKLRSLHRSHDAGIPSLSIDAFNETLGRAEHMSFDQRIAMMKKLSVAFCRVWSGVVSMKLKKMLEQLSLE
ncbi:hypothetical protein D0Y65_051879 [Glycine soja]|uniref:Uncharacterized protein n=1 Tax=Glycine soja TaxID=3848 RepID=A0A445FIE8_GLYSO|nr:hypothetical protein D0Y65_051879 [Glycine soja]